MLMHSINITPACSARLEPNEELDDIAKLPGRDKLNLPKCYHDIWLDSLLDTVKERDPEYNEHVDRAWRTVMAPGIEYMKSFCSK